MYVITVYNTNKCSSVVNQQDQCSTLFQQSPKVLLYRCREQEKGKCLKCFYCRCCCRGFLPIFFYLYIPFSICQSPHPWDRDRHPAITPSHDPKLLSPHFPGTYSSQSSQLSRNVQREGEGDKRAGILRKREGGLKGQCWKGEGERQDKRRVSNICPRIGGDGKA